MDTPDIRETLEQESKRLRKGQRILRWTGIAYGITVLPVLLYLLLVGRSADVGWLMLTAMPLQFTITHVSFNFQRRAGSRLAAVTDVRAVGPLAEAVVASDGVTRAAAEQALLRLLPRLQATDASLLSAQHRQALHGALKGYGSRWYPSAGSQFGYSVAFIVAVLRALEQIGDATSLPYVERLAKLPNHGTIQQAATACLPSLLARAEHERLSGTLLRPVGPTDTCAGTLLRPAHPHTETDPGLLLRASTSVDHE